MVRWPRAWDIEPERRAFAQTGFDGNRPTQERAVALRQGKAETCTSEFFSRVELGLTEVLEQALQAFLAHSDAGIAHFDDEPFRPVQLAAHDGKRNRAF